jgi:hypothetical protein
MYSYGTVTNYLLLVRIRKPNRNDNQFIQLVDMTKKPLAEMY